MTTTADVIETVEAPEDFTDAEIIAEPEPETAEPAVEESEPIADVVPIRAEAPRPAGALAVRPDQGMWDSEQEAALIAQFGLSQAPRGDVLAFLHVCQTTGLDPFRREVYLVGRRDSKAPSGHKWTVQTGIDGFRHLAERSGQFRGRTSPQWCGPDGVWRDVWLDTKNPPAAARVGVMREAFDLPVYGIAMYHEFAPMIAKRNDDGSKVRAADGSVQEVPQGLWAKMPAQMLAKVAEAQAIRAAFPRMAAGLYLHEEMHQAQAEADAVTAEQPDPRATARRDARLAQVNAQSAQRAQDAASAGLRAPETAESEVTVIQGTVVREEPQQAPASRDEVWAEAEAQASALSTTVAAMSRRWARANRKNLSDATAEEVAAFVLSQRPIVAESLRTAGYVNEAATYAASTDTAVDLIALLAGGGVAEDDEPDHDYLDDGSGVCVACGVAGVEEDGVLVH